MPLTQSLRILNENAVDLLQDPSILEEDPNVKKFEKVFDTIKDLLDGVTTSGICSATNHHHSESTHTSNYLQIRSI